MWILRGRAYPPRMKVVVRHVLIVLALMLALPARAQPPHSDLPEEDLSKERMAPFSPLGVSWARQTSGTSWQPT